MSPEQKDSIIDSTSKQLIAYLLSIHEGLLRRIREGASPKSALNEAINGLPKEFGDLMSSSMSGLIGKKISTSDIMNMQVSGLKLSKHLYNGSRAVSNNALNVINAHLKGFQNARSLALELFEGFGFKDREVLNISPNVQPIPKYLRQVTDNPIVAGRVNDVLARIQASNLKTPALKAAYLETLDAIKNSTGTEVLEKKLRVAFYERARFFSNRIAQTELQRAWVNSENQIIQNDPEIEFVQITLSGKHVITDICDLMSKQNKYGLGPGVYPKHLAPKPPFHPFCRCSVLPRVDIEPGTKWKEIKHADRAFLESLDSRQARAVMGSRAKLAAVLNGKKAIDVLNKQTDPFYRIGLTGRDGVTPTVPATNVIPLATKRSEDITNNSLFWDKKTRIGEWHEASFSNAPLAIKRIIRDLKGPDKLLANKKKHPHFRNDENYIEMDGESKEKTMGQSVWRHEYGHAIDYHYGVATSGSKRGYWSTQPIFREALSKDERFLINASNAAKDIIAKGDAHSARLKSEMGKLDNDGKDKFLNDLYKQSGLDYESVRNSLRKITALEDVREGAELKEFYLDFIVAWDRNDFEGAFFSMTGKSSVFARLAYLKGYLPNMSDLVGSITKNKVGGMETGFGHEDRYYNNEITRKEKEAFANIFSYYGQDDDFLIKMMEHFAPNTTKAFRSEFFK